MEKVLLFELKSLYRDNMKIYGYKFGDGEKSAAIVGGLRGNEVEQVYIGSQLVAKLKELEERGQIAEGKSIMVVPSVNPYSINSEKRFWPTDNTDINRMFPGYNLGETTQRIAAGVFSALEGYTYGIHLNTYYISGDFVPHVDIINTGRDYIESAKAFGFPYVCLSNPQPYDTTTLNYNWQIWETNAYSVFAAKNTGIDEKATDEIVNGILNFLNYNSLISYGHHRGYISSLINDEDMISIKSVKAGFFRPAVEINQYVQKGQLLAQITDAGDGSVLEEITAPENGVVFFIQSKALAFAQGQLIKLVKA